MLNENDLETRFAHLLNPIRDLSKNWNVDIATLLENYLSELDHVTITFDDGKTTMNFAEAALLIQGSTCVYSRKVEFLYKLVQEMLQSLLSKRKLRQVSSVASDGVDKDVSALEKDDHSDFLLLNDIRSVRNMDIKENSSNKKPFTLLPRTPTFFVPLDDNEKGAILNNPKGEQIGNKNDFKLGLSTLHSSGMLILDSVSCENDNFPPVIPLPEVMDYQCDNPPSPASSVGENGGHFTSNRVCDVDPEPEQIENENRGYNLRTRNRNPVDVNPFDGEDPYGESVKKDRPFKKGQTYKIMAELTTKNSKRKCKVKPAQKAKKISIFCHTEYFSDVTKFPKDKLKIPHFPELNKMYWQEQKDRQRNFLSKKNSMPNLSPNNADSGSEMSDAENDPADNNGGFGNDDNDLFPLNEIDDLFNMKSPHPVGDTYEDLVRNHVDLFMASAQNYGQVPELTKRVSEWEERMIPLLEKEEENRPFDIHEYGSLILNRFSNNNRKQTLPFYQIVLGKPKEEIARFFLSSLQLANTYNVEITTEGELEKAINTMELTLLSRKRVHEELEDYVAPSLQPST